jgi:hypothetical protein
MTEPVGRSARWGTAAVVAPLAAAALAAATGWGVAHQPSASGKNSPQSSGTAASAGRAVAAGQEPAALDKSLIALQQQASTEQARVIRLQKILNRLNAHTRALARAPLPGYNGASSAGGSVSVAGSGGAGAAVAAPPPVVAAPAPATHTSTGAS